MKSSIYIADKTTWETLDSKSAFVSAAIELYKITRRKLTNRFTKTELIVLCDLLNSTMIDSSSSVSSEFLVFEAEDFEKLESGISRHDANPEALIKKLKKLTMLEHSTLCFMIKAAWKAEAIIEFAQTFGSTP